MKKYTFIIISLFLVSLASAKIKVVASTADVLSLVKAIGGDKIEAVSVAKGSQDPHYIEAKPSYMIRLRDADLLVSNGLSLEVGWLPNLIRGARNPKVNPGQPGNLELGTLITPLSKPSGAITRAMGDVHPDGNPHFTLDPIRMADLGVKLGERLSEIDPIHKDFYRSQAKSYKELLVKKSAEWKERIEKTGVKNIVSYHPSLDYFFDRFGLNPSVYLENKPGIPPSAKHVLSVIETVKREKIKFIFIDNFFDTKIGDRVQKEAPNTKAVSVGIAVESAPGLNSLEDVVEQLVKVIEAE